MAGIDFDPTVDYYQALGVSSKASADEIKKAYRKLAKANHPDSTGGDKAKETRFKAISNAYEVLGDAKKRRQYDDIRSGAASYGPGGESGSAGFGGGGFPGGFPGGMGGQGQVFDLNDLFSQMFSGGAGPRGRGGGGRVRVVHSDFDGFEDAPRPGRQARADSEDAELESRVKASDGSWLRVIGNDVYSDVRIGFERAILGTVADVATVDGKATVKIPPGSSSGRKLRLRGKGVTTRAGQVGDHYVTVQIDVPSDLDDDGKRLLADLTSRIKKRAKSTS